MIRQYGTLVFLVTGREILAKHCTTLQAFVLRLDACTIRAEEENEE